MLTPEQRAELEEHGAASIRFKLTQYGAGRGASISGFKCGDIAELRELEENACQHPALNDVERSSEYRL